MSRTRKPGQLPQGPEHNTDPGGGGDSLGDSPPRGTARAGAGGPRARARGEAPRPRAGGGAPAGSCGRSPGGSSLRAVPRVLILYGVKRKRASGPEHVPDLRETVPGSSTFVPGINPNNPNNPRGAPPGLPAGLSPGGGTPAPPRSPRPQKRPFFDSTKKPIASVFVEC